jgi:SOS response regulatory protein OraA/RecX
MADRRTPDGLEAGALEAGLAALRYRDLSEHELQSKLVAKGFPEREREEAVATLKRTGVLDERRCAESRAESLATRGAADALIRHTLDQAGVAAELVDDVLEALPPERERAQEVLARRGRSQKTARYLAAKGFPPEIVHDVLGSGSREELG